MVHTPADMAHDLAAHNIIDNFLSDPCLAMVHSTSVFLVSWDSKLLKVMHCIRTWDAWVSDEQLTRLTMLRRLRSFRFAPLQLRSLPSSCLDICSTLIATYQ